MIEPRGSVKQTMGFINCNSGKLALVVNSLEVAAEGFSETELGRHVEETSPGMAAAQVIHNGITL